MSSPDSRPIRSRREQGLSLIELLAGMVVGLLVVMAALGTLLLSREAASSVSDLSQLQQQGAYALHVIGMQLRQTGAMDAVRDDATGRYAFGNHRAKAGRTDFAVFGVDGQGAATDKVSVAYAPAAWSNSAAAANGAVSKLPGQFDCSGSSVQGADRVDATFEVDAKGQLTCTGRTRQPVIRDVADFQIGYRVDTGKGVQIMEARAVESMKLWGAVTAIEVCLDLQGSEKGPDLGLSYKGCQGTDRPRNGHVHLVFRNVFSLRTP